MLNSLNKIGYLDNSIALSKLYYYAYNIDINTSVGVNLNLNMNNY